MALQWSLISGIVIRRPRCSPFSRLLRLFGFFLVFVPNFGRSALDLGSMPWVFSKGIALSLQTPLGSVDSVRMFVLSTHEQDICFHLFVSSSISSSSVFTSLSASLSPPRLNLFPGTVGYGVFLAIVSGMVSLTSLSARLLLLSKNGIAFRILIFYPAALPNSFIRFSGSFGWGLRDFCAKNRVASQHVMTISVLLSLFRCLSFLLLV